MPFSDRCSARSSAILLVMVVISTRSNKAALFSISDMTSSICPSLGLISTGGSTRPVGRTTCSTIFDDFSVSYIAGVAETKMVFLMYNSNSSNFSGRLSYALGSLNPYVISSFFLE